MKKRVTGIGGLFFKSKDPKAAKDWYNKHLGFNTDDYGCTFWTKDKEGNDCSTQWSPFKNDTKYFKYPTKLLGICGHAVWDYQPLHFSRVEISLNLDANYQAIRFNR